MIDSNGLLAEFLPTLRAADWVALDTEADSLHAYPEKLCLLQITTADGDRLIDPLANIDLSLLWPELKRHRLILHGADYDLRLLRKNHSFVPDRIFDTMLASRLLGEREFGLGNLLKKHLGVTLEKGSQKADWSKRPLTPRMEAYARNDTHYLKPLVDILTKELRQKERLGWLEQSCDRLIAECAIPAKAEPDLVWRVRGSNRLAGHTMAVLREIWHWREQEATAANRPPFFVLSHETIINLAIAATSHGPIEPLLPRHFSARRKDGLQEAIQQGLQLEPQQHPQPLALPFAAANRGRTAALFGTGKPAQPAGRGIGPGPDLDRQPRHLLALASDWEKHQGELMDWQRELLQPPAN